MLFKKHAKSFLDQDITREDRGSVSSMISPSSSIATPYLSPVSEPPQNEELEEIDDTPDVIIGEGVSFKGNLYFDRLLQLDGTFEGTLEHGKKIIVGPKGCLKAHAHLDEAFIAGKIEGDLCIKERLVLRGRAEVYGNITAPRLSVDEGVTIVGQLLISASHSQTHCSDS
ncbi:MAG: polymer-forming cytoskeletal protein [Simkania sp.]|nr:polymer-forming cytoskeletal protein [Simkania sp.]